MNKLAIVFDGPPSHESGRFVEVELNGESISFGEWQQNGEFWELVLSEPHAVLATMEQFVINADETAKELIAETKALHHLLEIYPPTYLVEEDEYLNVHCQACEGKWRDGPDAKQEHDDECEYAKLIAVE